MSDLLKRFYDYLSPNMKDLFSHFMNDVVTDCNDARLEELEKELKTVYAGIEKVNRRRELLSGEHRLMREIMKQLDGFAERGKKDLKVEMLRDFLTVKARRIRQRIIETKPIELLKRKVDLVDEKETLIRHQRIATLILQDVFEGRNGNEARRKDSGRSGAGLALPLQSH